jgi:hypothetical protein
MEPNPQNNHEERYEDNPNPDVAVVARDCPKAGIITFMRCTLPSHPQAASPKSSSAPSPPPPSSSRSTSVLFLLKLVSCNLDDSGVAVLSTIPSVVYLTLGTALS